MPPTSAFFRLHPSLRQVILSGLRWKELRDVQELAYDPIITGKNVLLTARTAGGKSEAAFIPILDQILTENPDLPVCLYISPLRALISDLSARLDTLLSPLHLSAIQVHGDAPRGEFSLQDPPAIILTTPESLTVLLYGNLAPFIIERVRVCIIDEVHALAGSERGAQLMAGLALMESRSGRPIQRVGLSATIGNPDDILSWMNRAGRPAQVIRADPEPLPREFIFLTDWDERGMTRLLSLLRGKRSLIFARSRSEAELLSGRLEGSGLPVFVHHSSLASSARKEAEGIFVHSSEGTIICTSTLELGIDLGSLDLVVQSGPLMSISSFLQRLGRVGRRGNPASMAFLLNGSMETVLVAAAITSAAAGMIEPVFPVRFPYRVLVQQIILSLLLEGRISAEDLKDRLARAMPDSISGERISFIISFLVARGFMISDRGFFMAGPGLEMWTRQISSLYSVIGEGRTCDIRTTDGDPVGTLPLGDPDLIQTRPFRLGGRSWKPVGYDSAPGSLQVRPDSIPADPPVFRGSSPGMSPTLLKSAASIIRDGFMDIQFPEPVLSSVQEISAALPPGIGPDTVVIVQEADQTRVYTFLGEDWNQVIGQFISAEYQKEFLRYPKGGFDGISVWFSSKKIDTEWVRDSLMTLRSLDAGDTVSWLTGLNEPARLYDLFLPDICLHEMICRDRVRIDALIETLSSKSIFVMK